MPLVQAGKAEEVGIRLSLRSRAAAAGLDMDSGSWICDLRCVGEISDDEWAEITAGWERDSDNSQEPDEDEAPQLAEPQPAVAAMAAPGSSCS